MEAAERRDPARRDERKLADVGRAGEGAQVIEFPGIGARGDREPGWCFPGEARCTGGDAGERDSGHQQPAVAVILPEDAPVLSALAAAALLRLLLRRAHRRRATTAQVTRLRPAPARIDQDDAGRRAA